MNRFLRSAFRVLLPKAWWSAYEGANYSQRRSRVPGVPPQDAKRDLSPAVRRELVRRSRYLHKNSGFVRELVGNMAIYSTGDGIKPQAQSGNPAWNKLAEDYFNRWAARCEITRRFSFEECQSIICRAMDVDGEYFVHKTRDKTGGPVLQLIESHRIGDLSGASDSTDGIGVDAFGAPVFYRTIEDAGASRDLPAESVLHVFEPESATAIRHAPTLQHSINHILDEMELLALEKHAVKDNADIARVLKTERGELDENGDFTLLSATSPIEQSDPATLQQIVGGNINDTATDFHAAVLARGRKIPPEAMEGQDFSGKQAQRLNLAGVVRDRADAIQRLRSFHVAFGAQARRVDTVPLAMKPIEEQLQEALARVQTLETDAQASASLLAEASANAETFKTQLAALTTERDRLTSDLTTARQSIQSLSTRNQELEGKEQDLEKRASHRAAEIVASTGTQVPAKITPAGDPDLPNAERSTPEERIAHYNDLVKHKQPKAAAEFYQKHIQPLFSK